MLHSNIFNTLDTPETRERIDGDLPWMFIAVSLTETRQPSTMIANKKCSLLRLALDGQKSSGSIPGPDFTTPLFQISQIVELDEELLGKWYTMLTSVDLWGPLLNKRTRNLSDSVFNVVIDQIDENIRSYIASTGAIRGALN